MAPCIGLACRIALPRAPSPLPRCGLREREREARPSAFAFSPATRRGPAPASPRTGPCFTADVRSLLPLLHRVLVAAHLLSVQFSSSPSYQQRTARNYLHPGLGSLAASEMFETLLKP
eukprot:scaffold134145_cov69-Phaeocystis_antarctica.AAC.1